jgi:hypothetical protein
MTENKPENSASDKMLEIMAKAFRFLFPETTAKLTGGFQELLRKVLGPHI